MDEATTGTTGNNTKEELKLSKNAQKRLIRQQKFAATREEWKKRMREKKKMKRRERPKEPKPEPIVQEPAQGHIIIDLAFESLMNSKEINSLVSQICRCYAENRKTKVPFKLTVSGLTDGLTQAELKRAYPQYDKWSVEFLGGPLEDLKADKDLVYLSPDADEVLEEINPNCSYIIGGLIDRNRHKNVAANRAKDLGIRSAKLPLADHVKLKSSQVLTILHVFELFCKHRELNSWPLAIEAVIPQRKVASE